MDYEKKGVIFNIQKFSINDGPGIRTVVFFKGCPLKCKWCANPESQNVKVEMLWDKNKCIHCNHCVDICSNKSIYFKDGMLKFDHKKYDGDKRFVIECKKNAISIEGEIKSVREVMEEVIKDMPFYEESNGGITLSGGEVLTQSKFSIELLKSAKEYGINTCIETTGYAPKSVFSQVIKYTDYILFDLKHYDNYKHIEGTGVSNEIVLKNMKYAFSMGKDILPRIPVIPMFNDTLIDAKGLSNTLKDIGIKKCQLLPFHQFGENKYQLLGMKYEYQNVKALHEDDLRDYIEVFIENGIDAFF